MEQRDPAVAEVVRREDGDARGSAASRNRGAQAISRDVGEQSSGSVPVFARRQRRLERVCEDVGEFDQSAALERWAAPHDRVDGATLPAEFPKVRPGQYGIGISKPQGR
jgi:hypothetical protein